MTQPAPRTFYKLLWLIWFLSLHALYLRSIAEGPRYFQRLRNHLCPPGQASRSTS